MSSNWWRPRGSTLDRRALLQPRPFQAGMAMVRAVLAVAAREA
jgi:hypothetical protein